MPIIGHGIDIVEVARVQRLIDEHGEQFLTRCFTSDEREYAGSHPKRHAEHLAARFAAKEAVMKVLGTGWRKGVRWVDIEVIREPSGRPTIRLFGESAAIAERLGIRDWHLSLSHTATHATASAVGEG